MLWKQSLVSTWPTWLFTAINKRFRNLSLGNGHTCLITTAIHFCYQVYNCGLLTSPPLTSKEKGPHGHFLATHFVLAVNCFYKERAKQYTSRKKINKFSPHQQVTQLLGVSCFSANEKSSNQELGRTSTSHFGSSKLLCQHSFPQQSFKVRLNIITSDYFQLASEG